jgi:hypothetical protein
MNTQLAFAFGMLTMVAVILLVVIVVGMIKVIELKGDLEDTQNQLSNFIDRVHRSPALSDLSREINDRIDDVLDKEDNDIKEIYRQLDSRLDKLEHKLSGTLGSKQIIN